MATKTRKQTVFNAGMFHPTEFDTAESKAKFANALAAFIDANFPKIKYTKAFYNRLCQIGGHIAHYDMGGFWSAWFADPESKLRFVQHWATVTGHGLPQFTWCDVERAVRKWIIDNKLLERQREICVREIAELNAKVAAEQTSLAGVSHVEFVVAGISENANSFGLKQYIMISRDGKAVAVHRSICNPWSPKQVIRVPVEDAGLKRVLNWAALSCEMPKELGPPPQTLLKWAWSS